MSEEQLKQNILDKIRNDDVKMTSKQFFILKWTTLFVTSLFFLMLGIYLFAYIAFLFIDNGLMAIPINSEAGLISFIIEIPWTLVLMGIISIFLFSITSKTFYRIYRKPFLIFFFSIFLLIVISHVLFVTTGAMNYLKEEAFKEHITLVPGSLLKFRDSQTGNLFTGYVVSTTTNSIIIRDRENNLLEIFSDDENKSLNLNDFSIGSKINAYGQKENQKIYAKSIEIYN